MQYSDLIGCPAFLFAEANKVHSLETFFFFNPNRYHSVMWPQLRQTKDFPGFGLF